MDAPAKRKLDEAIGDNDDVIFVIKHEPEEVRRNHTIKLRVGEHVQLCTRRAIQDLLPDPASFHAEPAVKSGLGAKSKGTECRVIIPEEIDPWAAHLVLLAALNEGMPLDCTSTANGLTLQKLRKAAEFFKVKGEKIGLAPEETDDDMVVPELAESVDDEPDQPPTNNEPQQPPTGNVEPKQPADDDPVDMPTRGDIYLFTADRNQIYLRRYDCDAAKSFHITLLEKVQAWSVYKEMGPMFAGGLLFRCGNGVQMKTYAYTFANKKLRSLFKDGVDNGVNYPLAVIDGMVYRWDFKTKGGNNKSLKYDMECEKIVATKLRLPTKFREQAACASSDDKFYYCGGFLIKDKTRTPVSIVEVYDVDEDKWSKLPNMQYARRGFAAQICSGYLYVTGGACNQDAGIRSSCERLKLGTPKAKWESIGRLRQARYQHSMFVMDGQVYVCGGRKALGNPATSVEYYDEENKCWRKVDVALGWPITACQASEE